jgi:hypothetical protein
VAFSRAIKRRREMVLDHFPSKSISSADYFFFLAAFFLAAFFLAGFFAIAFKLLVNKNY